MWSYVWTHAIYTIVKKEKEQKNKQKIECVCTCVYIYCAVICVYRHACVYVRACVCACICVCCFSFPYISKVHPVSWDFASASVVLFQQQNMSVNLECWKTLFPQLLTQLDKHEHTICFVWSDSVSWVTLPDMVDDTVKHQTENLTKRWTGLTTEHSSQK